ncbi:MAG TPA: hypothetical protein PKJ97_02075 [Candidatus Bilamarchaeaceae archaeon]|nr:hypothetical protein [Candidatus Bilamarchaeaceae archaeon]
MEKKEGAGGRYRFSLKKRYSFERKYRKVEVPVGEMIKAKILSALGRKPAQEEPRRKAPGIAPEEERKEAKPLLQVAPRAIFRIGGLFGLLFLLALVAFLFAQTISFPSEAWTSEAATAYLSMQVKGSDMLTLSDAESLRYPYRTAYSSIELASSGVRNITVNAQVYDSPPPNAVFVLRSSRFQAETYPLFISSLSSSLGEYGIGVNEI